MTEKIQTVKLNSSRIDMKAVLNAQTPPEPVEEVAHTEEKEEPEDIHQQHAEEIQNEVEPPITQSAPNENKSVNEVEEKRKKLLMLSRYRQSKRFGHFLAENGFDLSSNRIVGLSLQSLDALLNDVKFTIACKNTSGVVEAAAISGVMVLENVVTPWYNVKGLSECLSKSATYLDCVEEIALENQSYIYTKPTYRLMFEILKCAYMVHQQHSYVAELQKTEEGKAIFQQHVQRAMQEQQKQENKQPPTVDPLSGIIQPPPENTQRHQQPPSDG